MHPRYPNIFRPIRLGPVELRNRFYSSPHAVPMTVGSRPSDDYLHYIVARIRGGCSLTMLTMTMLDRARSFQPSPQPKENIPAFRAVADAVHREGGRIFGEPWYYWGAPGTWRPLSTPAPALTPSVAHFSYMDRGSATREMSKHEIRALIGALRESSANLREAGFDGVMVHAAHGALAEQFLSPYFNRRTDEYGGSLENRMRFLVESLRATREGAGDTMAVGMRLNCDELLAGGYDGHEAYRILKSVCDAGLIDFADLDVAVEPNQFYLGMPPVFVQPQVYRPYVEAVRKAAGTVPVLSVLGRTTSIAEAESALAAGVCDMVGAARALIAEPELVNNAFEGREERSRTCIACNWCMAAVSDGAAGCAINPESFRERLWSPAALKPATRASKVIVVGSGPAGLEAARVGALRGHSVTLFETRDQMGGALALWARLPGREFYARSIEWWEREVRRLGVSIRLGTEATAPALLEQRPDAVILATGARYSRGGRGSFRDFDIAGWEQDFVHGPEEILLGTVNPSGRIVVLDNEGLHTGVGIAELLAGRGSRVDYVTPNFSPVSARVTASQDTRFIMQRLRSVGVTISPTSYIRRIGNHSVIIDDVYSDAERLIEQVDAVVLTTGRESVNDLEKQLEGKVSQLFVVGDAAAARMWGTASYEGHLFARFIGEPDAPRSISDLYFGTDEAELLPVPAGMRQA